MQSTISQIMRCNKVRMPFKLLFIVGSTQSYGMWASSLIPLQWASERPLSEHSASACGDRDFILSKDQKLLFSWVIFSNGSHKEQCIMSQIHCRDFTAQRRTEQKNCRLQLLLNMMLASHTSRHASIHKEHFARPAQRLDHTERIRGSSQWYSCQHSRAPLR